MKRFIDFLADNDWAMTIFLGAMTGLLVGLVALMILSW